MQNFGWAGVDRKVLEKALMDAPPHLIQPLNIVGSGPTIDNLMLFRVTRKVLGKDTENYAQQIGDCKVAGTKVLRSDGSWKNIEEIQIGEEIISHLSSSKKVIRTIHKKYTGKLYTIQAKGHYSTVSSTADHEYISYLDDDLYRSTWKKIEDLDIDKDSVLIPYTFQEQEYNKINYYGKKIEIDEDFAYIIGWYLAEGGTSNSERVDKTLTYQKVTFNLCLDEEDVADILIEKIKKVFNLEAIKQYNKEKQNVLLLEVYNVDFSEFLHKLIPGDIYNKTVPTIIFRSPEDVKLSCLRAWLQGDGHLSKTYISGYSSSHKLIRDFFHLSISCGLSPKTTYREQQPHQNVGAGVLTFKNNSFNKLVGKELAYRDYDSTRNIRARHVRSNHLGQLREIEYKSYEEVQNLDVYCLEVEDDHSFIANGYAVHNCVSFGAKNVTEYLQCCQIAMGNLVSFHPIFPPYAYGTSRLIGNMLGGQDGSVGIFAAQAANQYGELAADADGVPKYAGSVAKSWGASKTPWQNFVVVGKQHLVQKTAKVSTWDDLLAAITNLYPVTVASDVGFTMAPQSDGFHHRKGSWGHQMAIIGVDNGDSSKNIEPHACILNSWGDVMGGPMVDFRDPTLTWPVGTLRVRKADIETMINQEDTWTYSSFQDFELQSLPIDFFSMF